MRKQILKWRRDRWVGQVTRVGGQLRRLRIYRSGINADILPEEASYTDAQINRLERRHERLLANLKETANHV